MTSRMKHARKNRRGARVPFLAAALGVAACMTLSMWAMAAVPDARAFVETLGGRVIGILKTPHIDTTERERRFHALFLADFDAPAIGRFVLGAEWRALKPDQRTQYLQLFGDYVASIYAVQFAHYSGEKLEVTGETKQGDDTFVETRIDRPSEQPLDVVYRVRDEANSPKIVDVTVDAVSLIVTKRAEFASVIQHYGFDGLMQRMRAAVQRTQSNKS